MLEVTVVPALGLGWLLEMVEVVKLQFLVTTWVHAGSLLLMQQFVQRLNWGQREHHVGQQWLNSPGLMPLGFAGRVQGQQNDIFTIML